MTTPRPKTMPYKRDTRKELLKALVAISEPIGRQKLNELKKPIPKNPNFDEVVHLSEQDLFEKKARYKV